MGAQSLPKAWNPESVLIGFENGPGGILKKQCRELTEDQIQKVRNQGGFDLLGSGRTKIATTEQLDAALDVCKQLSLNGLVAIGWSALRTMSLWNARSNRSPTSPSSQRRWLPPRPPCHRLWK